MRQKKKTQGSSVTFTHSNVLLSVCVCMCVWASAQARVHACGWKMSACVRVQKLSRGPAVTQSEIRTGQSAAVLREWEIRRRERHLCASRAESSRGKGGGRAHREEIRGGKKKKKGETLSASQSSTVCPHGRTDVEVAVPLRSREQLLAVHQVSAWEGGTARSTSPLNHSAVWLSLRFSWV